MKRLSMVAKEIEAALPRDRDTFGDPLKMKFKGWDVKLLKGGRGFMYSRFDMPSAADGEGELTVTFTRDYDTKAEWAYDAYDYPKDPTGTLEWDGEDSSIPKILEQAYKDALNQAKSKGYSGADIAGTVALTSDRDLRRLAQAIDAQFQSGGSAQMKSAKVMKVNGENTMVAEVGVSDPFGFNFEWYEKAIKNQIETMGLPLEGLSAMKPAGKRGDLKIFHWYYV